MFFYFLIHMLFHLMILFRLHFVDRLICPLQLMKDHWVHNGRPVEPNWSSSILYSSTNYHTTCLYCIKVINFIFCCYYFLLLPLLDLWLMVSIGCLCCTSICASFFFSSRKFIFSMIRCVVIIFYALWQQ